MIELSVVIPLYNKEQSIGNTVNSVLAQTYSDFKLIIVDDGSTDRSLELVKNVEDSRIEIIQKNNRGACSARNKGIEAVKSGWIAFLDADDLWVKDHLENAVKLIKLYPDIRVFSTTFIKDTDEIPPNNIGQNYVIDNYFKDALTKYIICSSTAIIHKECFDKVGLFNEKLSSGEDLDMWARLARKYKFGKSDSITAIYRIEAENRAMRRYSPFENSYASTITLKGVTDKYERMYLKKQFKIKFKLCLYNKEFRSLFKLFWKMISEML